MKAVTALICELETQNVDVYVGKPNAELCDCSNALLQDIAQSDVAFDTVLVTPGGPGTQNEAQLFLEAGVSILTFCNSADEKFGSPPWFSSLSSGVGTFDLLGMKTQDAVAAVMQTSRAEEESIADAVVNTTTTETEAEAATKAKTKAANDENAAMLVSMGFSESAVAGALEATHGSLEHAADWLFVHATDYPLHEGHAVIEPEVTESPSFPVEWLGFQHDLVEMGFSHEQAEMALLECNGDIKKAVKELVSKERTIKHAEEQPENM